GGPLVFTLGAERSDWGTPMPLTRVDESGFVPAPVLQASRSFRDAQDITLASLEPEATVLRHTRDRRPMSPGRRPTTDLLVRVDDGPIARYTGPLAIDTTATVTAWAVDAGGNQSAPARGTLIERPNDWTITLGSTFAPHYAGASDDALIDGIRADAEWRKGDWQGFYDQDLVATVDFRETRTLNAVYLGVLQDSRPWILFPREVVFEASGDGETFREILRVRPTVPPRDETPQTAAMGGVLSAPEAARYLRVRALPVERLPEWHLGAGHPAWIFADEIWVEAAEG
ncbi:MAG: chitobiase/beta-hexosaminidase C-terminal domain-containing protein, partial [Bacteroidota bacterium]